MPGRFFLQPGFFHRFSRIAERRPQIARKPMGRVIFFIVVRAEVHGGIPDLSLGRTRYVGMKQIEIGNNGSARHAFVHITDRTVLIDLHDETDMRKPVIGENSVFVADRRAHV